MSVTLFSDFKEATCLKIPKGKRILFTGRNPSIISPSFLLLTVLYDDLKFSQWNKTTFSLISVETWRRALLSCRSSETKISWFLCSDSVIISVLPMRLGLQEHFLKQTQRLMHSKPVGNTVVGTFHGQKSVGFVWPIAMQSQFTASVRNFCWSTKLLFCQQQNVSVTTVYSSLL